MAHFYERFKDDRILKNTMFTMRPVVLGLIAAAVVVLIPTALTQMGEIDFCSVTAFLRSFDLISVIIAVLALVCVLGFKISPIIVVFAGGVVGVLIYLLT